MKMHTMEERKAVAGQLAVLYCPICTRYVDGLVRQEGKRIQPVPGQRCPRCVSSLDAAAFVQLRRAA